MIVEGEHHIVRENRLLAVTHSMAQLKLPTLFTSVMVLLLHVTMIRNATHSFPKIALVVPLGPENPCAGFPHHRLRDLKQSVHRDSTISKTLSSSSSALYSSVGAGGKWAPRNTAGKSIIRCSLRQHVRESTIVPRCGKGVTVPQREAHVSS